jgi:hypothetical protein
MVGFLYIFLPDVTNDHSLMVFTSSPQAFYLFSLKQASFYGYPTFVNAVEWNGRHEDSCGLTARPVESEVPGMESNSPQSTSKIKKTVDKLDCSSSLSTV